MIFQNGVDLLLDLVGQAVQLSGPAMAATGALQQHHGEASHDEGAALVMAFRTFNWEWIVGIRHGHTESGPILTQSLERSNLRNARSHHGKVTSRLGRRIVLDILACKRWRFRTRRLTVVEFGDITVGWPFNVGLMAGLLLLRPNANTFSRPAHLFATYIVMRRASP
jgi:hypothetical protein